MLRRVYEASRADYDRIQLDARVELAGRKPSNLACTVRLLSGCADHELSYDGPENGHFTAALLDAWNFGRFSGNYAKFHADLVKRISMPQNPQHNVVGRPDPAFDKERPFAIMRAKPPSTFARAAKLMEEGMNPSQRATIAIETYIRDERPNDIGSWRSSKPSSDWGMSLIAWISVAERIIGVFNGLDPQGGVIDLESDAVRIAIENLHGEALGIFHQYLANKIDTEAQIERLKVAETRDLAEAQP